MKKSYAFLLVVLMFLMAPVLAGDFKVDNAWIREAPPGSKNLVAYMTLENEKENTLVLTGAVSSEFESIEMHHTIIKDDIASMVRQYSIRIAPYSIEKFEPTGLHMMLINPRRELKEGDKVKIALLFSNYRKIKVVFLVRKGDGKKH